MKTFTPVFPTYDMLKEMGNGYFSCGFWNGWISVEYDPVKQVAEAMWCSHKNSHDPLWGPAISVSMDSNNNVIDVFKSAITMHRVTSPDEILTCECFIANKVRGAYKKARCF